MPKQTSINVKELKKVERDPVTREEFDGAMRRILSHDAEPNDKLGNREPTKEELTQRWKLVRRA